MSKRDARTAAALDFAWRVHATQEAWTAKVDVKASIVLAISGGALFAVLGAHSDGGILEHICAPASVAHALGIGLLILAVFTSAEAIFPLLGPRRPNRDKLGLIYFGHLRHQSGATIARRIDGLDTHDQRRMLAEQLSQMARRNWIKHRLLQISLIFGLCGAAAILTAIVLA